ncbi:formin-binding protein 1 isoform X6 [Pygocentrus nattereri]|uniref:formin-binding protein 1 isoform X6 n=1 Tax=Pygocentrus nattereri TaxID=42514 RepID=UPI0018918BF9|nr:formin-binding protein 1 isoform X6 [Pygocentrus nattereri]
MKKISSVLEQWRSFIGFLFLRMERGCSTRTKLSTFYRDQNLTMMMPCLMPSGLSSRRITGRFYQDQFENLEKHTQWGIDFVERYTKFVKERSEIELNYAKQIRNLSKKYQPKKNAKEEEENKYTWCRAFFTSLNELNDYAGQHELIAENMTSQIIAELTRYIQDLKSERKSHFQDGRKAQQHIENSWKQLEQCKRNFERACKEADRAQQHFEKMDADINVTKADVEKRCYLKARQQAQLRHQMAADCKSEYSNYLQKFNQEQTEHYHTLIPNIFQKIQEMEERRIERLGESMKTFAEVDRQILPIVGKCLDGMTKAAESIEPKTDSAQVVESYKSGFEPPGDVEFEDYGQAMKRTASETSLTNSRPDVKADKSSKGKSKLFFFKKNKLMSLLTSPAPRQPPPEPPSPSAVTPDPCPTPQTPKQPKEALSHRFNDLMTSKPKMHCLRSLRRGSPQSLHYHKELMKRTLGRPTYAFEARQYVLSLKLGANPEDFSHLPPEQRRKKLQAKIDDINKDIQKEMDQRDALTKMKDVYVKNPQMGDPSSVDPRLAEIGQHIDKLQAELQKFEGWLAEVEGRMPTRSESSHRQSVVYETQNSTPPTNNSCAQDRESSPDGSYTEEQSSELQPKVQTDPEFDEFEEEMLPTIGTCKALYPFEGQNEGTLALVEGEVLFVIEEDKGDGWTRVRRNEEEEGYVPTSYVEVFLDSNAKGLYLWD